MTFQELYAKYLYELYTKTSADIPSVKSEDKGTEEEDDDEDDDDVAEDKRQEEEDEEVLLIQRKGDIRL